MALGGSSPCVISYDYYDDYYYHYYYYYYHYYYYQYYYCYYYYCYYDDYYHYYDYYSYYSYYYPHIHCTHSAAFARSVGAGQQSLRRAEASYSPLADCSVRKTASAAPHKG